MNKFKILALLLMAIICLNATAKKKKQPNVLVIYTDDHRFTGVHALGGQAVKTPNMDKLVDNGVAFTNTYLMGSFLGATCVPSRAMLHTGKQLFKLDVLGRKMPESQTTMGEAFKNAGYQTHIVGKWHQDNASLVRSFESGSRIMGCGVYFTDHFRMPLWDYDPTAKFTKKDAYILVYNEKGEVVRRAVNKTDKRGPYSTEEDGPHTSEIFAENASKYIQNHKGKKPFFMYLAFHAPHDPRQAPKEYMDMYPPESIELPPSYMQQHPFDNGHLVLRDEELGSWPRTPEVAREHLAAYYAIITHLDDQIGKVIAALKESGEYDNTLIVFAGDSGLAVGCHGLLGKQNTYDEDGLHVPFVLSGGAAPAHGVKSDAFCYIHDIFPTVCDVVKIEKPTSVDGKSMLPVLTQEKASVRDYTYHVYRQHQRAYRKDDYKLIEFVKSEGKDWKRGIEVTGSRVTLLFNTKNDPWETTNLAFLPEYKEIVAQMQTEMKAKAIELGDNKETHGYDYDFWENYD